MLNEKKKIEMSIKLYPYYYGLSADLMFWAVINTLFLTTVKDFTASQINSLISLSVLISFISYFLILKLIKKIGELKAIKIGNILLLISSICITFLKSYGGVLFGLTLYEIAFVFKSMDYIILRRDLEYLHEENKFFTIATKGTLIYSIITMIISLIAGLIFNLNNYLPMYICIFFCFLNYIISNFLYCKEDTNNKDEKIETSKKAKIKFNKTILFILLFYLLIYCVIETSQTNAKLILQYNMEKFLTTENVAFLLSFIIFLSRIARVLGNIIFNKIYNRFKDKLSIIINILLIIALTFILLGDLVQNGYIGIAVITIGFAILLLLRDPTENYGRTILFNNTQKKFHDEFSAYYTLSRKIGKFSISLIVSIILLELDIKYAFIFLLVICVLTLYITSKITRTLQKNEEKENI